MWPVADDSVHENWLYVKKKKKKKKKMKLVLNGNN